jgi:hypothetical protein
LATVHGIVKQHAGWVTVRSQVNVGTRFEVYFPLHQTGNRQPRPQQGVAPEKGSETILAVEDEEPVLRVLISVLARRGYRVLAADSADRALELWGQHKDAIDLLFTDVVMPGRLTGKDLAQRLRAEKPGLKVMFTSGYKTDFCLMGDGLAADTDLLIKPYSPSALVRKLRRCLDGKP